VAEKTEAWDVGAEVQGALAALVGVGQGLLNVVIWFGIVWLPVLLVLSMLMLVALRAVLEVRRRLPLAPEPAPASGDVPPA
jgi:ABC-type Na+ efflux pump permease subunit